MKRALITGITGQDGSYLAELLLAKGYEVHGLVRSLRANTARLRQLENDPEIWGVRLVLHYGDLTNALQLQQLIARLDVDEVYHLAAQSHVHVSFDLPEYTGDITGLSTLRLLEAIRTVDRPIRFFHAGSSEMFGQAEESPQHENTPLRPRSPYGCAKAFGHLTTLNYRDSYGLFAVSGILFNHESPRRGETFVTRKITRAVARIHAGLERRLKLGNLSARRDWGYAKEYVEAMWLMLQQPEPRDFVIATGAAHSVSEFLAEAFGHRQLDWRDFVDIDAAQMRPSDVDVLVGDASKARAQLGWVPRVHFKELVQLMVDADGAILAP